MAQTEKSGNDQAVNVIEVQFKFQRESDTKESTRYLPPVCRHCTTSNEALDATVLNATQTTGGRLHIQR